MKDNVRAQLCLPEKENGQNACSLLIAWPSTDVWISGLDTRLNQRLGM